MGEKLKQLTAIQKHYLIAFFASLAVALGLLITGFCLPPRGEIHPSVLEGTGIIFLWPALAFGAKTLEEGNKAKIQHGDTTITIGTDGEPEN